MYLQHRPCPRLSMCMRHHCNGYSQSDKTTEIRPAGQVPEVSISYFSLQVFEVQSAYNFAAGSALARTPKRWGGRLSCSSPCCTSARRLLAMLVANSTLHDAG